MNILFLTKYENLGASSRYRTYQYLPFLQKQGIQCVTLSLFNDEYLINRYKQGKPSLTSVFIGFFHRVVVFFSLKRYDLVVIEKELLPYLPFFIEGMILTRARAYTLDFDDALFHIYDQHRKSLVRKLLDDKYPRLLSNAALITAGNDYIAQYALQHAKRVEILPTVIDIGKYAIKPEPDRAFTIGWVGTPNTQKYLHLIEKPLQKFFSERKGRLLLIGANDNFKLKSVPTEIIPWNEQEEVSLLQSIHVGIMPLPDLPLERGKSGLKLLQYMACSRPVVASPVGVNVEIVNSDVGYLADSDETWFSSLIKLADNKELRTRMGNQGRVLVEEKYSLEKWAPKYAEMLRSAAGRRSS